MANCFAGLNNPLLGTLGVLILVVGCEDKIVPPPEKPIIVTEPAPTPAPFAGKVEKDTTPPSKEVESVEVEEAVTQNSPPDSAGQESDAYASFEKARSEIAHSPFKYTIHRAYLEGACHSGGRPEARSDVAGVGAVIEGTIEYQGKDLLYSAELDGALLMRIGQNQVHSVAVELSRPGKLNRTKVVSAFDRTVRGVDPWVGKQVRSFHWETHKFNPIFCEVNPEEVEAYIAVQVDGVHTGRTLYPVAFVPLPWSDVLGTSLEQQVLALARRGKQVNEEPADAHFAKFDEILITTLAGETKWVNREEIKEKESIRAASSAMFPVKATLRNWEIKVKNIANAKEFGGYAPRGDDRFLSVLDVVFTYMPSKRTDGLKPESGKLDSLSLRLQNNPGKWSSQETKAMGQIDTSVKLAPGQSVAGKVVFPRQRFERPFRLEVSLFGAGKTYIDVFSYLIGSERAVSE